MVKPGLGGFSVQIAPNEEAMLAFRAALAGDLAGMAHYCAVDAKRSHEAALRICSDGKRLLIFHEEEEGPPPEVVAETDVPDEDEPGAGNDP